MNYNIFPKQYNELLFHPCKVTLSSHTITAPQTEHCKTHTQKKTTRALEANKTRQAQNDVTFQACCLSLQQQWLKIQKFFCFVGIVLKRPCHQRQPQKSKRNMKLKKKNDSAGSGKRGVGLGKA